MEAAYRKKEEKTEILKRIKIARKDLGIVYPQIGQGSEGSIYKIDSSTVVKIFDFSNYYNFNKKFEKVKYLSQFSDASFTFPQSLVYFEDGTKTGYATDLVLTSKRLKTFYDLRFVNDRLKVINCLLKAEEAIKRAHKSNIIIGDLRDDNIMIDKSGNPIFVDTDNYSVPHFGFDAVPYVTTIYEKTYKRPCSLINNDKFTFALMALQYFTDGTILSMASSPYFFRELIEFLDISDHSKEMLTAIFSTSEDKPYLSEMLKEIDPDKPLIQKEQVFALNRIF